MGDKLSPQEFVAKWRNVEQKESVVAHSHFEDLCALLGEKPPLEADPKGTWYTLDDLLDPARLELLRAVLGAGAPAAG